MQVDEEELLQDCATSEHILQSKTAECDGKKSACRQQAEMIQRLTRDTERITIRSLDPTPNKPSYENEGCFLQQPIARVESLFSGFSSHLKEPSTNQQQLAELDVGSFFERGYRGRHQSYRHVEMTEPKLQQLRDADIGNDSVPSRRVGGASFAQHQQASIKSRFGKKIVGGGDVPSPSNEKWGKLARAGAYV